VINKEQASIIMPVYNGASTLPRVFADLERQENKGIIDELIIIDDASKDHSAELIGKYAKEGSFKVRVVKHTSSRGLASGYNEGIELANTKFVITMHQDMLLKDPESFNKILRPMELDPQTVAAYPTVLHPLAVWREYNFWQKCLFSRFVGKKIENLTGKFDGFNREAILKIGLFDDITFRTAGEDGDLKVRIKRARKQSESSGVQVIHLHNIESNFDFKRLVKKEAQLAEAQGTLLRKYGFSNPLHMAAVFFREILLLLLLVPFVRVVDVALILIYAFVYTGRVYISEFRDIRILILPAVNIFLLFVALSMSTRGLVRGRQTI
jgi:glycosyltransferase involved in cell wall biosynthesis